MRWFGGHFRLLPVAGFCALTLACGSGSACAQDSGFKVEFHANSHGTAAEVGLPGYPGATLVKKTDDDSNADFGFTVGESYFRLVVAKYTTADLPGQVLAFYRKALSRYGDVIECDQGKPVGPLTATRGGLACSDDKDSGVNVSSHSAPSGQHEMRAGSPHRFRIVAIEDAQPQSTRFVLVYVDSAKVDGKDDRAK